MATADYFTTSCGMIDEQTEWPAKKRSGRLHTAKDRAVAANGDKKALTANRPLYGLPGLAEKPKASVVIVEGEKTADAAAVVFPNSVVTTWSGGSNAVDKADWSPLSGREDVLLLPDADEPGRAAMLRVAHILANVGIPNIKIVDVYKLTATAPDGSRKAVENGWDLADALAEGWGPVELEKATIALAQPFKVGVPQAAPDQPSHDWPEPKTLPEGLLKRPRLLIENCNPHRTVAGLRDILAAAGGLYDRGVPVRLAFDQMQRGTVAQVMTPDVLVLMAHTACRPYIVKAKNDGELYETDARLPRPFAVMYLDWRGEWRLPALNGIATAPLLQDDGAIQSAKGYDSASAMWCENVPDLSALIPERPTKADAVAALRLIRETFKTFCFADAEMIDDAATGVQVVDMGKPPGRDDTASGSP